MWTNVMFTIDQDKFWHIFTGPHHSSLSHIIVCEQNIGTRLATHWSPLMHKFPGIINLIVHLLLPRICPGKTIFRTFCAEFINLIVEDRYWFKRTGHYLRNGTWTIVTVYINTLYWNTTSQIRLGENSSYHQRGIQDLWYICYNFLIPKGAESENN